MMMKIDVDHVRALGGVGDASFEIHKALMEFFEDAVVVQDDTTSGGIHLIPLGRYQTETSGERLLGLNKGMLRRSNYCKVSGHLRLSQISCGDFPHVIHPKKYVQSEDFIKSCGVTASLTIGEDKKLQDFFSELFAIADANKCIALASFMKHDTLLENDTKATRYSFHFFVAHDMPDDHLTLALTFAIFVEFN